MAYDLGLLAAAQTAFANVSLGPEKDRMLHSSLALEIADKLVKDKNFKDACVHYIKAAAVILGRDVPFHPNSPYHLPAYEQLELRWAMSDVMRCLNGAAECLMKLKQYKQALWLAAEVEVIVRNCQVESSRANPVFEWFDFCPQLEDYYVQRLRARVVSEKIYRTLGNTGTANERRWHSTTLLADDNAMESAETRKIFKTIPLDPVYKLHHPDPALASSLAVTDPSLQVLGSWQKVPLKKSGGITSRMGFASFVFEDLTALDEWRARPAYPVRKSVTGDLVGYSMVVHGDSAYLFTGRRELDVFNLRTQSWGSLKTSFPGSQAWPYPEDKIVDYAMYCVRGKIYIFGGAHALAKIGCTLLMELDIASRTWTRLHGTAQPTASFAGPGPRRLACSWVGKDQNTLFVMHGVADRQAAQLAGQPHGAMNSQALDDLWVWDIAAWSWSRRRLVGNVPAPRSEMACTYNAVLDKVITFGGYTPTCPSHFEKNVAYVFSYYGDTFMYGADASSSEATSPTNINAPSWKHVLTRGFPTYRAQAHLVADPDTGRTFLFGGYVNSEYVPSRSGTGTHAAHEARIFGDLWELRLDVPGGHFADVDVEEEARTARVGPWQRWNKRNAVSLLEVPAAFTRTGGSIEYKELDVVLYLTQLGSHSHILVPLPFAKA
ncbi:hypothetical protein DFH06DRAFT_1465584 [Mycena polygramma]|nr:hypothetical protein DFH06DRAFT_1465584 [Mycena polygramma]